MKGIENMVDLQETLKPLYERALEAEERLSKLEAAVSNKKDDGHGLSIVSDLQSQLESAKSELIVEREKASREIQKLVSENAKLQYRISHLVRALKVADAKLSGHLIRTLKEDDA